MPETKKDDIRYRGVLEATVSFDEKSGDVREHDFKENEGVKTKHAKRFILSDSTEPGTMARVERRRAGSAQLLTADVLVITLLEDIARKLERLEMAMLSIREPYAARSFADRKEQRLS